MLGRRPFSTRTVAAILAGVAIVGCIERVTGPGGATGAEFAAHLVAQDGNSQRGAVSHALAVPVTVKVTDAGGLAVKGATVTFSVRQGGGSVSAPTTASGAAGVASTIWTLGPKLGPQQMVAILSGAFTLDSTVFTATATNGPASHIDIDAGDAQRISVGATLVTPLSAKVTDDGGNPVPDAPVTWSVASGGGQITVIRQNTDSTGRAFATWKLGTTSGQQTANAAIASGATIGFRATADAGAPTQLIQETGSGQTGVVGRSLSTLLSVRVVDSYGNGVRAAIVSFSADDGSIASIGTGTDSLGRIQGRWTLGQKVGLQSSLASLAGTAPVPFVATGRASNPTSVTIETGANQSQAVRQTLPLPLVARITDSFGNPVAGIAITWNVVQGGGTLLATSATSDSTGRTTAIWTLGGTTGSQLVTLSVPALPLVVFSATATPGALDTLAIVAGNNQSGTVSTALGTPLIVRQVDANGNPVVGASVIFAVVSGGGSVTPAIATTDVNGRATANWTIGSFAGAQTVTATSGAKTVTFVATGAAAGGGGGGGALTPAQIVLVSGNGQVGNVGAQLGQPMVVKVLDINGIPVTGTTVTWTMAGGNAGGFVSPSTAPTDGSGQASTIWLLGSKVGLQTLTASVASPALSLQLIATATLGSSGAVLINSGNNQTAPTGALLASRLLVKVVDQNNNAVVGARVTWTVATGGGSLTQTANAGITNGSGLDSASWTLGSTVGAQTVTAAVAGVGSVTFTATATTAGGTAATIRIISGDGQVGRSAQLLPTPLVVEVRDASGNILSGITVTFTQDPVKNPDGFTSPAPVTTGADGRATVSWTLGKNITTTTAPMAVTASPAGVPAAVVTFNATARPEYRIQRVTTPFLQADTTSATIGAPGDYVAGVRDTLRVQVYDPTNNIGVQGISVTWATQAPSTVDGHPLNATSVTDNFGFAKTLWVLRADDGAAIPPSNVAKRMFAMASVGQVEFQASVTPGSICSVTQNSSSGSPGVGSSLADTATVKDCNGFPVPGALVTFSVGSGSVTPVSATTNSVGQAFTTWTLGTTAPTVQTLNATASAKAVPYNAGGDPTFSATSSRSVTVVAGAANSVVLSGASPATPQAAGNQVPITVIVRDAFNNLVSGQAVSFVATNSGTTPGTVSSASVTTGAGGTASIVWTLGNTGSNKLTATAGGAAPLTVTVAVP